jgi:hypothetical protein
MKTIQTLREMLNIVKTHENHTTLQQMRTIEVMHENHRNPSTNVENWSNSWKPYKPFEKCWTLLKLMKTTQHFNKWGKLK